MSGPRQTGFTLLEILLALVLVALAMVGVWGALAGATRITHAADAVMAQGEQVRAVQRFLRRYLTLAGRYPYVTGSNARAQVFRGDATSLQYVAPLPMQSGHAGLYLQTVSLRKDGQHTLLQLTYRPYPGPRAVPGKSVTHLLLSDLRGGRLRYLAAATVNGASGWHSRWNGANGLPVAVRIHLDPAWPTRVPFPDMVIPIAAGGGAGLPAGDGP